MLYDWYKKITKSSSPINKDQWLRCCCISYAISINRGIKWISSVTRMKVFLSILIKTMVEKSCSFSYDVDICTSMAVAFSASIFYSGISSREIQKPMRWQNIFYSFFYDNQLEARNRHQHLFFFHLKKGLSTHMFEVR